MLNNKGRLIGCVLLAACFAVAACSRAKKVEVVDGTPNGEQPANTAKGTRRIGGGLGASAGNVLGSVGATVSPAGSSLAGTATNEPDKIEKYETALRNGLQLLADENLTDALAALEAARSWNDTEEIRITIGQLRQRLDQESAAERLVSDIQTVLDEGRPEEASRLATDALQLFGHTSFAARLTSLKRQSDAITNVQLDAKTRRERFVSEAESALKEGNLRAAIIAYEQANSVGDDAEVAKRLDELRARVTRYDELCERAATLRREPSELENAVALLQEAKKLWDNPTVAQSIDEYSLALQSRRDRLSVAAFETRGDVGLPEAGVYVADELLSFFKRRFDLVERSQMEKVASELKLQESSFDDLAATRELGRVAKVRYLVVGSITPISGITVHARLIDVTTGLVVQTAKISVDTTNDLAARLPQLADILQMTDEEKLAFEQKQLADATPVVVVAPPADATVPAPPPPPSPDVTPPAPLVPAVPQVPPLSGLQPGDFDRLPPPPTDPQAIVMPAIPPDRDAVVRQRALFVAIELGDNLFRRGRFIEAHNQYQFCLSLAPHIRDIRLRIAQCEPLLPPPPAPIVYRPQLAVIDFVVAGNPLMVPPHLGSWTAQGIAAYFSPGYELVDRARLYWYMGRLGITTRDLLYDPAARYYLGRALNIRFFLFGTIRETASFDVATYMVHAEHGYLTNGARIHCRNIAELKIRLPELAWRTSLDQAERIRLQRDEASWTLLVNDIRQRHNRNDYAATIRLCQDALRRRPGNVEIAIIQRDCEDQLQRLAMLEARNNSYRQQQQLFIQIQDRRGEVARAAELARIQAEQHALALPMNERLAVQRNRETAYQNLVTQAQIAIQGKRFGVALQLFHSAAAIRPNDAIYREIAVVKAQADQAERERDLAVRALHEANLRKQREAELAQARTLLEAERQRRDADELARRKAQDARDQQEYARLLDLAQRLSAKGQFDQAVGAAQRAKQIRPTNEAERLVNQLLVEQAKAAAERQGAAARAKLEADLAAERQRRADAEAELAKARQQFDLLLREANAALAAEQFERALERYGAAAKLHRTDAVLSGIRSAETGIARRKAIAEAEKTRLAQQEQKAAKLKSVLADANAAMIAKDYGRAVSLFREAKRLAPTNVDALAGLTQAEQKLERVAAEVRRKDEDKSRKESFQKLLASGKASLAANRFEAAAIALAEAVRLMPDNAEAKSALDEANRQLGADAKRQTELKKKMDEYQRHIADGRRAMSTKQFDQAIKAFNSAILLLPDDKASKDYLAEAVAAKNKADADIVIEAQKRQEAARRNVALNSALAKVRGALAARDVAAATAAYRDAAKIDANHEEVKQALLDVRRLQDHMQAAADNEKRLGQKIDDLITKARSALAAKRFDEAIEALSEANRLRPNQKVIADLMAQATKGRADTTKTTPVADDRQKKVAALIVEAKTAIAAKQWDAAEKFLNDANRLIPRSADVQKLLVEIDTGRKQMMVDDQLRKRQAAFQVAIKAAQEALTAKRLDDAANAVADALKLQPNDAAALALQRQIQSAKDNTAAQMKIEQLKRDVAKFVDQANKALTAKQFDVAEKALADALKIAPNDRDLLTLRGRIQSAKADAQAAMKADQTRAEVAKLLGDARKALTSRQLDEADKAIDNALRLMPGNQDAMALRTQVKQARSSADAAMKSEQRKQEFNKLIAQTKASLFAKKLDEATKNVRDALQLFPNDPTAIDLVRQIDAARQAQNAAMKKEQDRKSEYDRQMKLGRAAMAGRRFEEAARAFTAALAQMPNDAAATQLLAEVKKALEVPKKPAGPPPGYKVQMDAGDGHLKAQKWADAAKAFQYATRIAPGDAEASKRMRFASSMDDGDKAMKAKRFAEAVRHFEQALRLIPDNKDAQDLLNRAKKSK